MNINAWPFLVSRNKYIGYSVIVAPDFILDAKISNLIANYAGGDLTRQGQVSCRKIYNTLVGDITLIFRVIVADDGEKAFKDGYGRRIDWIEGFVLKGNVSKAIVITDNDMQKAHDYVEPHYHEFWNSQSSFPPRPSKAFSLKMNNNAKQHLDLIQLEPYNAESITQKHIDTSSSSIKPSIVNIDNNQGDNNSKPEIILQAEEIISNRTITNAHRDSLTHNWVQQEFPYSYHKITPLKSLISDPKQSRCIFLYAGWLDLVDINCSRSVLHNPPISGYEYNALAFHPNGKGFVVVDINPIKKTSLVFYVALRRGGFFRTRQTDLVEEEELISAVDFISNGSYVIYGTESGYISLVDIKSRKLTLRQLSHKRKISAIVSSCSTDTFISSDVDGVLKVWRRTSRNELTSQTEIKHHSSIHSIALTSDGNTIASGNEDGTIRLWDVFTGGEKKILRGHTDAISQVVFSPDNRTLVSGSSDKSIKVWDIATGRNTHTFDYNSPVNSVAFNHDGRFFIGGSEDCAVKLFMCGECM